jgi:hypothetical protein
MTRANSTEIIVVLDRSGSMASIKADMEGGFNTFLAEQKKVSGECRVSLFQFDDQFEQVYTAVPLAEVPALLIEPRGSTALYDAVAQAMNLTGQRLAKLPEWNRPAKIVFMVITDGCENASREYSGPSGQARVKAIIEHQESKYNWGFVYLGSSPTTQQDAHGIGIRAASNYVASAAGVHAMNATVGQAVRGYRNAPAEATMDSFIVENIGEDMPEPVEPEPSFFAKP